MTSLEHFDNYRKLGWELIPLKRDTKIPILKGWTKKYDHEQMRDHFINDNYNLGLFLGRIIDLEADDETANRRLSRLAAIVPHPCYKSAKSVHHLFQTPDKKLTRVVIDGIEFRGKNHQSVLPPSTVNGTEYTWISTAGFCIPPLPVSLFNIYRHYAKLKFKTRNWVQPWCGVCGDLSRPIHCKRYQLELAVFKNSGRKWTCHKCRKTDIRSACRKIKKQLDI